MAGALWIACPYLFFFDRLALSDAEAGALVVLALFASWLLAEKGTIRRAVFAGIALALAVLFKFTAAPFALSVALIVLLRARYPLTRRIGLLALVGLVAALCFAPPILYLMLRGGDLFSIALAWVGGGSGGQLSIGANVAMLVAQLLGFSLPIWSMALVAGLALLVVRKPRTGGILLLAVGLPLLSMIVLGRDVLPRHYVAALPPLLVLGGAGVGAAMDSWLTTRKQRQQALVITSALLAFGFIPFALHAYTLPPDLRVPQAVWTQYFSQHSSGYGLREAVQDLPQTTGDAPVIASMTGDSCRRANFYAVDGKAMRCANAPSLDEVGAALRESSVVYVVVESVTGARFPADADALGANTEQIAVYPRPGADGQPVTLWKLTRR
jgi:hypothetical protein